MNKQTQFRRMPDGMKTPRMLKVEQKIGRTLEEDYKINYLDGAWGQKRLSNHWGVSRGQIFAQMRGGRRNWKQMLKLPDKNLSEKHSTRQLREKCCEVCGVNNVSLEGAHWIPAHKGGSSKSDNILRLCPNCHKRLDNLEDPETMMRAREVLLLRAAETYLQSTSVRDKSVQLRFFKLCTTIIERKGLW